MSKTKISFERTYTIVIKGTITPGYDAPPCQNHDSPAFSDPGCGPEIEWEVDQKRSDCPEWIVELLEGNGPGADNTESEWEDDIIDLELDKQSDGPDPDQAYDAWRDKEPMDDAERDINDERE